MEPIAGSPGRAGGLRKHTKLENIIKFGGLKWLNLDNFYKPLQGNVVSLRPATEGNLMQLILSSSWEHSTGLNLFN